MHALHFPKLVITHNLKKTKNQIIRYGWNFKQLGRLLSYQYNVQGCLFYNQKSNKETTNGA